MRIGDRSKAKFDPSTPQSLALAHHKQQNIVRAAGAAAAAAAAAAAGV
jgi:hypothetical protein